MMGIRFSYGDFNDVLDLLEKEPFTRQAFLPIWFPEDTGCHHGERVPCTIGYHFMRRGNFLSVVYMIRSCDYIRQSCNCCLLLRFPKRGWVTRDIKTSKTSYLSRSRYSFACLRMRVVLSASNVTRLCCRSMIRDCSWS